MEDYDKLAEQTGQLTLSPLQVDEDGWIGMDEDGDNTWVEATTSHTIETLLKKEEFETHYVRPLLTVTCEENQLFVDGEEVQVAYWRPPEEVEDLELDGDENYPAAYRGDVEQIIGVQGAIYRTRTEALNLLREWGVIK
jgi:hypothetical protein